MARAMATIQNSHYAKNMKNQQMDFTNMVFYITNMISYISYDKDEGEVVASDDRRVKLLPFLRICVQQYQCCNLYSFPGIY